ncbi:interleukin-4 [Apus apus]|uniref:interleukin-4 n=1 Tax=Apus apus TaxID=8895 RepID=UPI0021F86EAF|nr:interleukin-4 [Apus apus]
MSIPGPVLLTVLALWAGQAGAAALVQPSILLQESIQLLGALLESQVSCNKMNVTNIFAGNKHDNDLEVLCKATTVALEGRSCHQHLEGISLNLLSLVRRESSAPQGPCPVAAGDTTSLNQFLVDLRRVLQRLVKDSSFK